MNPFTTTWPSEPDLDPARPRPSSSSSDLIIEKRTRTRRKDEDEQELQAEMHRRHGIATHRFQLLIALLWGTVTAFAMASEMYSSMVQCGGLVVAWLLSLIASGCMALLAWTRCRAGLLLAAYIAVACLSGFLNDSESESILRYLAVLPAFSIVLAVVMKGDAAAAQFRIGLTLAGFALVVFHLFYLEPDSLLDPSARLTVFLNTNSTGFIAVMTAVSAVDFVFSSRTRWQRVFWATVFFLCVVIWLSTKSRTALLALIAGVLTFGMLRYHVIEVLRFQFSRRPLLIVLFLFGAVGMMAVRKDFIVDVLSLQDDYRSIQSGTGRYEIWRFVLTEVWPEDPWFGVGPGNHGDLVLEATGSVNAHNGLVAALAETGLCGAIPVLVLIGLCFRSIGRGWRDPRVIWAASLFAAGLSESMGEVMLFSIGSPGSLLFMLALASLAIQRPKLSPRPSASRIADPIPLQVPSIPVA